GEGVMTQMLDVLFLKKTGHVLTAVVRPGGADDPPASALAGDRPFYPLAPPEAKKPVLEVPIPADAELDRVSVPLTDDKAAVLFQREIHQVKDGDLVPGLASVALGRTGNTVTVTIPSVTSGTPYIAVGMRDGGGDPKLLQGEIPQSTGSYPLPE